MNRLLVLSANLGGYDPPSDWEPQALPAGWEIAVERLDDASFPPRCKALSSALQAGIPKMFGWQLRPGFDAYLWVDASRRLVRPDFAAWMLAHLDDGAELAVFRHPLRGSVREEYQYVRDKLAAGNLYLTRRYAGEWLDEQMAAIAADQRFHDRVLYASTAFVYRPTAQVTAALSEWWLHKARYLLHDQLALPYVLWRWGVEVQPIESDIYRLPYWDYVRK
jgi:hypothetical protein